MIKKEKKKQKSYYVKKGVGDYKVGYGKPDPAKRIQKGEVRNPTGSKGTIEQRILRATTKQTLAESIQKIITLTEEEVKHILKNDAPTALEAIILGTVLDAIKHRNYNKLEDLLARVIGKVPDKVDVSSNVRAINITEKDSAKIKEIVREVENEY